MAKHFWAWLSVVSWAILAAIAIAVQQQRLEIINASTATTCIAIPSIYVPTRWL